MSTSLRALSGAIKTALDAAARALGYANVADVAAKAADKSARDAATSTDTIRVLVANTSGQSDTATTAAATATAQAGVATTKAGEAAGSATAALAAKVAAEAARDSVNTTGRVYTSVQGTAPALADGTIAVGQGFAVLSADSLSYTIYRKDAGPVATAMYSQYTGAYLDKVGTFTDVYWQGKRALFARIGGSASTVGDVITEDGQHYAKYAIRGVNGVVVTRQGDGFYELSAGNFDTLSFTGGAAVGGLTDYYYAGQKVVRAWVDSTGCASIIETADGAVYIPKLATLASGSGVVVTRRADGFTQFDLGNVDSLPFTGGNTIGGTSDYYYAGQKVVRAWVDTSNRVSLVETADGVVTIPKLSSPSLDLAGISAPLETANYLFDVALTGGKQQVFRTSKTGGVRTQATTTGNNTAPRVSNDGAKLFYVTDRNGPREGMYQLLGGAKFGGSVEHPMLPRKTIMALGDSLTAADYAGSVAVNVGASLLLPSTDPRCGIGSQTSDQIAARYGATPLTCTVLGNSIAAGANPLTALSVQLLSRFSDVNGTVRTLRATLAGLAGTLTSTQSPTPVGNALTFGGQYYLYTFTPDGGQALPVACPVGSTLTIDPEDRQDSVLLVWAANNDVDTAGWQAPAKANIAAIVAAYKPVVRNVVVVGVINSTARPSGSASYNEIVAFNLDLAALYPDNFVDVRPAYNSGTATDIPNPAYTSDGLHYNNTGKAVIAAVVSAFMQSKGWF